MIPEIKSLLGWETFGHLYFEMRVECPVHVTQHHDASSLQFDHIIDAEIGIDQLDHCPVLEEELVRGNFNLPFGLILVQLLLGLKRSETSVCSSFIDLLWLASFERDWDWNLHVFVHGLFAFINWVLVWAEVAFVDIIHVLLLDVAPLEDFERVLVKVRVVRVLSLRLRRIVKVRINFFLASKLGVLKLLDETLLLFA
jgi:hypothetical protein